MSYKVPTKGQLLARACSSSSKNLADLRRSRKPYFVNIGVCGKEGSHGSSSCHHIEDSFGEAGKKHKLWKCKDGGKLVKVEVKNISKYPSPSYFSPV